MGDIEDQTVPSVEREESTSEGDNVTIIVTAAIVVVVLTVCGLLCYREVQRRKQETGILRETARRESVRQAIKLRCQELRLSEDNSSYLEIMDLKVPSVTFSDIISISTNSSPSGSSEMLDHDGSTQSQAPSHSHNHNHYYHVHQVKDNHRLRFHLQPLPDYKRPPQDSKMRQNRHHHHHHHHHHYHHHLHQHEYKMSKEHKHNETGRSLTSQCQRSHSADNIFVQCSATTEHCKDTYRMNEPRHPIPHRASSDHSLFSSTSKKTTITLQDKGAVTQKVGCVTDRTHKKGESCRAGASSQSERSLAALAQLGKCLETKTEHNGQCGGEIPKQPEHCVELSPKQNEQCLQTLGEPKEKCLTTTLSIPSEQALRSASSGAGAQRTAVST